jgi:beta-phosphoglucomutase-like phosphatase (HAD superfamily)
VMLKFLMCIGLICIQSCFGDVKAVLFDCDGTLVDSEHAHYVCWKKALLDLGNDLSQEEYFHYVGNSETTVAKLLAQKTGLNCSERSSKEK